MDIYIFLKKMDIYIYKPTVAANTIIILELIEKIISGVSLFHSIKGFDFHILYLNFSSFVDLIYLSNSPNQ